jgi:hypothetical protein
MEQMNYEHKDENVVMLAIKGIVFSTHSSVGEEDVVVRRI